MSKTATAQSTSETLEAVRELFSIREWKNTIKEINNDPEALRILSAYGYVISFALGGVLTLLAVIAFS